MYFIRLQNIVHIVFEMFRLIKIVYRYKYYRHQTNDWLSLDLKNKLNYLDRKCKLYMKR